jgi:hypothetical protein
LGERDCGASREEKCYGNRKRLVHERGSWPMVLPFPEVNVFRSGAFRYLQRFYLAAAQDGQTSLAARPNGGLTVLGSPSTAAHRDLIIGLAARHRLPAVYPYRYFVTSGGIVSYGIDTFDLYRRATEYIDRTLKGEKPADLPVQQPTKFELVINLKTAKTLGIDVPAMLLARADEVIE